MRIVVLTAWLLFMNFSIFGASREAQWKQVEDAVNKGLPRSAITNLEPIITAALADKAYPEALKAIARKISLEGQIQGNKPEEKISRLEAEIAKAPAEMVPMMETLLAHWYWQYFQQNRWRFMQRTTTGTPPGDDFTTWDLARLFAEIDRHFQTARSSETSLKTTPVTAWDGLLEKGTMPEAYRPTLYDFIAHEALEFYTSAEQAGAKPQDAFELLASGPALDSVEQFLAWNPAISATNSSAFRALRLFQDLLRFHQDDPAPALAFYHVDLERLSWAGNTSTGENREQRYEGALRAFIDKTLDFEISALASEKLGRLLQGRDDLVQAREVAHRAAQLFPESPGGKLCRNLVNEIEASSISMVTERVWNQPWPDITVSYRNLTNLYFRAVPYDWDVFLDRRRNRPENLNQREREEVLAKTPALRWSHALEPTTDYKENKVDLPAPSTLKPGFYFIIASPDPGFGDSDNVVSMTDVWVSDLAIVHRTRSGSVEGFVLDARTGEPLQGAQIDSWYLDQQRNRSSGPSVRTDANGFFSFNAAQPRGYLLRARYQGRELATAGELYAYRREQEERAYGRTVLFTDRLLYRPGQTVQYKGICLWVDRARDNYELLKGESVTIRFLDVNGKEIATQRHQANDYGSFSGSFTAPRDRVMGRMSLQVEGRANGSTPVQVEEYKRPKFQVTLEAPKSAPKLNEKVTLTGHAMSYTGAAVDGGMVSYRVARVVRMPWWWRAWRAFPSAEEQEIAHGTTQTAVDGSFVIEFTAKPDLRVPEKDEPTFVFSVNADVTDNAGETRSDSRDIRVGYTALEATMQANDWQTEGDPVQIKIKTTTLDGEPQVTEGALKIYELQSPANVQRPKLPTGYQPYYRGFNPGATDQKDEAQDMSDPANWPLGRLVEERGFSTDTNGETAVSLKLPAGAYRAMLETQDRFGKKVTGQLQLQVLNPEATRLATKIPFLLAAPEWEVAPGDDFFALWGTGYDTGRAFVEIEYSNRIIERYWTKPGQTQQRVTVRVTEEMRGGFTVHVTQVRENRAYLETRNVSVPWTNKELELKWEHFVSKLQPGQKETWTLEVRPVLSSAEKAVSEMVATLYDESLDAFAPFDWTRRFDVFRMNYSNLRSQFENQPRGFNPILGSWKMPREQVVITYPSFPRGLVQDQGVGVGRFYRLNALSMGRGIAPAPAAAPMVAEAAAAPATLALADASFGLTERIAAAPAQKAEPESAKPAPTPDLSQVSARKNLNETAFFFPHLVSDSNGVVRMTFTMPEALTKWRFMGFAHDSQLRSGFLEDHAVTAKDLMVQPNPPRFLREGDTVEFTIKVTNQSDDRQTGRVRLNFSQALNQESADQLLGNNSPERDFDVPAKESRSYSWRITVPDGCGYLTYKAVGATATVSDGEEGAIPVLSRRILVRESLALPIRGPGTKRFEFEKLLKSGESETLQSQSLTVQMVSNPAWYAVLALPYLIEYPHECSEQVFNRFYANALARSIAGSDPKIRRVFDQWKNTPALDSPLEKNEDLKAVAIEETPWVRQAESESAARRNVGILFDENRLNHEQEITFNKLTQMQLEDGSWSWFPGGRGNDYITLYIVTGFGRLRHLGVDIDASPAIRSLQRLDNWMAERYERIQEGKNPEEYVPSHIDALYLYGRSFFLKDTPIASNHKTPLEFFLKQARKYWLQTGNRQTQGHLALALYRFNSFNSANDSTPQDIMRSLKERSVSSEEMGMFWRDTELSWWWYRAPIETQALMIEAFDEVAKDTQSVEDCRVWLLKQKQTQDWKTTKATADAVYALLLRGRDLLSSDALVELKLDDMNVTPGKQSTGSRTSAPGANAVEPGTGFYEARFTRGEIKPEWGKITVIKQDEGVAWGSVHWQYLEDMSKVTPYTGTPLTLKKTLYARKLTASGPVLELVKGPLAVGDELVVRIELRTDRDMEYVHMKDQRGSGTEPVNVLSQYKYQDGLAYYESTRDTASHFFIDYLPKGTYVFEYSTRVQLRGEYQTGMALIECMYAPEFGSHSESVGLTVH